MVITPPRRRAETSRRWRKAPDAAPHLHEAVRPLLPTEAVVHAVFRSLQILELLNRFFRDLDVHKTRVLITSVSSFSRQVLLAVLERPIVVFL